jgi:uncharacterized membrane protein
VAWVVSAFAVIVLAGAMGFAYADAAPPQLALVAFVLLVAGVLFPAKRGLDDALERRARLNRARRLAEGAGQRASREGSDREKPVLARHAKVSGEDPEA